MDDWQKFHKTSLSEKEEFYSFIFIVCKDFKIKGDLNKIIFRRIS